MGKKIKYECFSNRKTQFRLRPYQAKFKPVDLEMDAPILEEIKIESASPLHYIVGETYSLEVKIS